MNLWKNWDDKQKAAAIRMVGLCFAALALWAFIASLSYLFTWKQDQSLLTMPGDISPDVVGHNHGGKFGYRLGHTLVCGWFGIGSFVLLLIPVSISVRLVARKWKRSLLDTGAAALSGAVLCSLILAFAGNLLGLQSAFGGGLGGRFGAFVVRWCDNLFGGIATFVFIAILAALWMMCCGARFNEWVSRIVARKATAGAQPDGLGTDPMTGAGVGTDDGGQDTGVGGGQPECPSGGGESPEDAGVPGIAGGDPLPACPGTGASAGGVDSPSVGGAPVPDGGSGGGIDVVRDDGLSTVIKKPLERIEPRKDELKDYRFPSLELLGEHRTRKQEVTKDELQRNNNKIRTALANYRIQLDDVRAIVGPTVTLYKLYPAKGVKIAEIKRLQEDLAMSLNARGVRVTVLEDAVGVEVANDVPSIVPLRAVLNDKDFRESKAELPVAIGYTITQKVKVFDLAETPHLLVAGATRQGKSVGLNAIVTSLLYAKHPAELKFVFIDPKMVEFSSYAELLHHYLAVLPDSVDERDEKNSAIVKNPKDAEKVLRSLCMEMDERYGLLSKAYVNNLKSYDDKYQDRKLLPTDGHRYLPYLVVVIDEYADLTLSSGASPEVKASSKSIQNSIIRLAQKGRAAGIHVILATQRPSVDVISGVIKANFPTRIAFRVISRVDSNTILDSPGAEKLIGNGDMIYYSGVESERIQCAYISGKEIVDITRFIGEQQGWNKSYNTPYYLPDPTPADGEGGGMVDMKDLDERFEDAARLVVTTQKGSTSDLQRKLAVGYAKAGRIMDQLEAAGIVGPQEGSKPRQVLVHDFNELDPILKAFRH